VTDAARVRIGAAVRGDLGGVAELAAATLREAWSEASFGEMLGVPGAVCLVARGRGGALAGFVVGQCVADELHVLSLAVAPGWRRRGVASALLAAAAGTPAIPLVLLEVRPSNVAARGFYRAIGFEEVGRRRSYYPDGEDALLLTLEAASCRSRLVAGDPAA
jgi:ribosomal-protein-alanine N-acetyltransferase